MAHVECEFCRRHIVLVRLVRRLVEHSGTCEVFASTAKVLAETFDLSYAEVRLIRADGCVATVSSYGTPATAPVSMPLVRHDEHMGELLVSAVAGKRLTEGEGALLEEFANGMAVAAYVAQVTARLQQSRRHLIAVREQERSRLRRDLHDRLGPVLTAGLMRVQVLLPSMLGSSAGRVSVLLGEMSEELGMAIAEVRRIARELDPVALSAGDLSRALTTQVERFERASGGSLHITIEAPAGVWHLPAALELAAYQIVSEALTNVAKYAQATRCVVRMEFDADLRLEVIDNGVGLPNSYVPGIGISSMKMRAWEMGGHALVERTGPHGTRVWARIPLTAAAAEPMFREALCEW